MSNKDASIVLAIGAGAAGVLSWVDMSYLTYCLFLMVAAILIRRVGK